ncbi:acetylglutamate kinase [Bacillus aquiflavi]|uniref:Acetylglutamate kinase n=1 Tax=Bacillus aquiflavi TaxID=2672567 RepID=A0A6B3VYL9_9BACI|nr:acetylglutamate kinase [Bacillus aquiflavi]MBA4536475.1 acetylglutamate kinase [Bacillus aquiflavi]NEY80843.1 acetylglutamate kinase [Bacillus aquiflavi]
MKIIVIKCGGSIVDKLSPTFFDSLHLMMKTGYVPIFVHGGGPDINKMLELYEIEPIFHHGLRKTTKETLRVVEMVLTGETNRKLTAKLQEHGFNPLGLSGSDGGCLQGVFIDKEKLGYVGEINAVNKQLMINLIEKNYLPVLTPIAITEKGTKLNVNADYAAAAVAVALKAEQCLFVTDVKGILMNGEVIKSISVAETYKLIENGTITRGMIPKVESAISAIHKGMQSARIVSGKTAIFENDLFLGTKIFEKERVLK